VGQGPPPPSPSDSGVDLAHNSQAEWTGPSLKTQVGRIRERLGLAAETSLVRVVAVANEREGLAAKGGLVPQVERLMGRLFGEGTAA